MLQSLQLMFMQIHKKSKKGSIFYIKSLQPYFLTILPSTKQLYLYYILFLELLIQDADLEYIFNRRYNLQIYTVMNREQWKRKTTFQQYLSVFEVATKQVVLLYTYYITNLVKWVCLHCTIAVSYTHWTFKSCLPIITVGQDELHTLIK